MNRILQDLVNLLDLERLEENIFAADSRGISVRAIVET